MPKLTREKRKKIAPFLLSMLQRDMSLREIQDTLSSIKPLTWQAIADILDSQYSEEYSRIMKLRKSKVGKNK